MRATQRPAIERGVSRCASKRRQVQAAYLFGSVAAGRARADSDIDVAVLLAPSVPRSRCLDYRLQLMVDLTAALHRDAVDVVILNQASSLLAHRVLSRGKIVFERSRSHRVRFQVRTASRCLDMIPTYEMLVRHLKRYSDAGTAVG